MANFVVLTTGPTLGVAGPYDVGCNVDNNEDNNEDNNVDDKGGVPNFYVGNLMMKTIQMTIDEGLLEDVDRTVNELGTNRSLFIRDALQSAIRQHEIEKMEARHDAGYRAKPQRDDEISEWVDEQLWSEE